MDRTEGIQPGWTPGMTEPGHLSADNSELLLTICTSARGYFEAQGLNHMDAQDLAVETSLRWLIQVRQRRLACQAWLRHVSRNLLIDHCRRRGREERLLDAYAEALRSAAEENHPADGRCAELCKDTLPALPPEDREILLGHYFEGFKIKELASRLDLSPDCVKQRLHRARERLRVCMSRSENGAT